MKVKEFNKVYNLLKGENGKRNFEELQYNGYFFIDLTPKQLQKIAVLMIGYGYEHNDEYVWAPNGLRFTR